MKGGDMRLWMAVLDGCDVDSEAARRPTMGDDGGART
jgi:hypothetical protein